MEAGEEAREEGLHPQEIDAYWLQRRIARAFSDIDADTSQKLAEEVLATLQARASLLALERFACSVSTSGCHAESQGL